MLWLNKNRFFHHYLPLILSVILLAVGLGAYFVIHKDTPKADAAWYSTAWTYRTPLTINHNLVNTATGTTTPLTNFPVLVSTTQTFLKSISNGGNVASSTGADILFTDSTGNTQIPYEREFYASSTGQLVAWVKIASLSSQADTTIYMYYGNATSGLADQQQASSVWDSNFKGVWHMGESSGNLSDSTINSRTAYPINSPTYGAAGQIDGALSVTKASTQYATTTPANSLNQPTFTIEAWFTNGLASSETGVLYSENGVAGNIVVIEKNAFTSVLRARAYNNFAGAILTGSTNISSGLHHVAMVKNSSNDWVLYVDGVQEATSTTTVALASSATNASIGNNLSVSCANGCWTGKADEMRVSHTNRSADWIATGYNNQSNPATFLSLGTQQSRNWYGDWQYRKAIVIDRTKVSQVNGTTLTDFPMLYSVTDSDLKYSSFGGGVASSTGTDILFTASDGVTKIPYEREYYASSTGQLVAWVKIPTLSATSDTVIYVYYGNSGSATDQQQATSVWDSSYKMVYHFDEVNAFKNTPIADSTANQNHATTSNTTLPVVGTSDGKINTALSFEGNQATVLIPERFASAAKVTFSAWVKPSTLTANRGFTGGFVNGANQFIFRESGDGTGLNLIGNGGSTGSTPNGILSTSIWSYVTFSFDGSQSSNADKLKIYGNGVQQSLTFSGTLPSAIHGIDKTVGPGTLFAGIMDEARYSDGIRSADWVKTEYNNQNSPSTFYSTQTQQVVSSSATPHSGLSSRTGWYNTAWPYRMQITIDHTKVSTASSTTLTNFPFLASTTSASLKTITNGGGVASSTGADILFTSSDGVTKLAHEIESYASTTGAVLAWVKVPTLSPTTDTVLYMYYGNQTSGLANQQQAASVWDSSFSAVWHFKETPSGTAGELRDSTSNGVNGQTFGSMGSGSQVSGQIGGSLTFLRPSLQYADFGSPASSEIGTGDFTIGTWVAKNATSSSFNDTFIVNKWNTGTAFGTNEWSMGFDQSGTDNKPNFVVESGNTSYTANDPNNLNVGQWYYLVGVRSGTNLLLYRNGLLVATATMPSNTSVNNIPARTIRFARSNIPLYSSMTTDETRMAQTARSADWIVTEYNNQGNAASFETWSGQQSVSGGVNAWKDTGWTSRKTLIINHEKVSGTSALTNFPVLVNITDNDLRTVANGGQMGQSDGRDIYFTASDGVTVLSYEREKYTASTGELVAWVKVPNLSPASDTVLYMYYGNSSGSLADQQSASSVWDSNYLDVWHMNNDPNGTAPQILDSVATSNNGTVTILAGTITSTSSQIGNAVAMTHSTSNGSYVQMANSDTYDSATANTIEAWVKGNALRPTAYGAIFGYGSGVCSGLYSLGLLIDGSNNFQIIGHQGGACGVDTLNASTTVNSLNTAFHHLVYVSDATGHRIYVDGVQVTPVYNVGNSSTAINFSSVSSGTSVIRFGIRPQESSGGVNGILDEIRVSNVVRSSDWIKTEYNNQFSPSTFVYVGQRDTTQRPSSTPSLKTRGNVKFR